MPRTGAEQGEAVPEFHQPCEDTGSSKTWGRHKVTCERRVEELIKEKLIGGLEPNVHVRQWQ